MSSRLIVTDSRASRVKPSRAKAASAIHREGSDELAKWVKTQKSRLYGGREAAMVRDMKRHLDGIAITGPGNKAAASA